MISYKDILNVITTKLIKEFRIEINSNDVKEGFKRPSFFVDFDNVRRSSTEEQIERGLTIRIYYFPSDRNKNEVELLDVQEELESLFELKLGVFDRSFNIIETFSEVTDGVLNFSFDIEYFEGKEIEEAEPMENLEFNNENN
ncbi:phage tail terminator family protein [Bacillus sp. FJAT-45350]|uniref:phage tail terminator family protein n=1 Tax=Bacillus sp. FJAT-45350 TaxID=2011014 RepID=UPI000BB8AE6E|nr:hypothetical protein [Bacillus sp. FJAT-45350]